MFTIYIERLYIIFVLSIEQTSITIWKNDHGHELCSSSVYIIYLYIIVKYNTYILYSPRKLIRWTIARRSLIQSSSILYFIYDMTYWLYFCKDHFILLQCACTHEQIIYIDLFAGRTKKKYIYYITYAINIYYNLHPKRTVLNLFDHCFHFIIIIIFVF